jgi:hypothetical protein
MLVVSTNIKERRAGKKTNKTGYFAKNGIIFSS